MTGHPLDLSQDECNQAFKDVLPGRERCLRAQPARYEPAAEYQHRHDHPGEHERRGDRERPQGEVRYVIR